MGREMRATGLQWLSSREDGILGIGMTVFSFPRLGMMPVSTDSWYSCDNIGANSPAQIWRRWPEMLSGLEVFLTLVLLNWRVTSSSEIMISPGEGEGEGEVTRSSMHSDVKSLVSKQV